MSLNRLTVSSAIQEETGPSSTAFGTSTCALRFEAKFLYYHMLLWSSLRHVEPAAIQHVRVSRLTLFHYILQTVPHYNRVRERLRKNCMRANDVFNGDVSKTTPKN
jgi:hypothetical protein